MKKIFGILICTLVIACAYTTTATPVNFTDTKKSNEILPTNVEAPIQPIVETEQVDGRTWNIKVYAYNTLDEEVTIKYAPRMVYTHIDISDPPQYYTRVYDHFGPLKFNFQFIPFMSLIYPYTKNFQPHEKLLVDEYTFNGMTNRGLYVRLYTHLPLIKPLPDGLYHIGISMLYKYNGEPIDVGMNECAYITLES